MEGYVQIYTGNGKGKTTAALGMAVRAAGAGKKVFIAQFMKGRKYSECKALHRFYPDIVIKQYGRKQFICGKPDEKDQNAFGRGFNHVKKILFSHQYDLIILDEINLAVYFKLIDIEELLSFLRDKPKNVELILTGRYAHPRVIKMADLVTRMQEVKHYFQKGISARRGIEM